MNWHQDSYREAQYRPQAAYDKAYSMFEATYQTLVPIYDMMAESV